MATFLDKLTDFIDNLDPKTLHELNQISIIQTFQKGDFLLQPGEVCKKSYWIKEGVARKYYLDNGKEITTEIAFKDDIAVSFESYTLQQPSKEFIQATTHLVASVTHYQAFQRAKQTYPALVELDLMMIEYYAMWLEDRLVQFHTLDAKGRYALLLEKHPHFIQQVPLTYLASYLGISLETLSRIRAKI